MPLTALARQRGPGPMQGFLSALHATLHKRTEERPIARSREPQVRHWLDLQWRKFIQAHPGPWLLAPNCRACGLRGWLSHGALFLSWKTEPLERLYPPPIREDYYLGTFKTWELAARIEGPNSPIMMAVHGRTPSDKTEWRLRNFGFGPAGPSAPALNEALKRAAWVNALAESQWAKPNSYGSIATPYRAAPPLPPP